MTSEGLSKPKRLTRRDFLKGLGLGIGTLALGKSTWPEGRRWVIAKERFPSLNVAYILYPTKRNPHGEIWTIEANAQGFFDALEYIALREEGRAGIAKMNSFFEEKPVAIEFVGTLPGAGQYIPRSWPFEPKGPRIRYLTTKREELITILDYIEIERIADTSGRRLPDRELGYHEAFHVWQEIRSPLSYASEQFNMSYDHPIEVEAREKSSQICEERNKQARPDQFFIVTRLR